MRMSVARLIIVGFVLFPIYQPATAHAQATRTWVSGVGDDANPCSRTAPCKTFAGAISKTTTGGIINCLDPGGFGAITITNSITLDCHEIYGSVLVTGTNGITVSASGATVILRNINVDGLLQTGSAGLIGVSITAAANVYIEDCLVEGFSEQGIKDTRTGGQLWVSNTTVRDNTGAGVGISSAVSVTLTNLLSEGNGFGVSMGPGAKAIVQRATLSGNTVGADSEGAAIVINDSSISNNGTGFTQSGSGFFAVSNDNIFNNGVLATGTIQSFTNNRFGDNGAGGTITPIGTTSNPTGLN